MSTKAGKIFKPITSLHRVSYKIFLILFVFFGIVAVLALRHNNTTMIGLRNELYAADKSGSGVEESLDKLRVYVYSHMNTDLASGGNAIKPPIQLKHTYERLESAAQAAANKSSLYTEAENYCQAKIPAGISGRGRVPCVQDYIMSHGGNASVAIPTGLYQFDFVSPTWSPDLAGWSLAASVLFFIGFAANFLTARFKR